MGMHFAPPPPAAISRVLARFDRRQLEGFIAVAIDLLDVADGDADDEDDERGSEMMVSAGIDYDPYVDEVEPDGLPGDPADGEEDDPSGTPLDDGEGPAWIELNGDDQTGTTHLGDHEDDEVSDLTTLHRHVCRLRDTRCDVIPHRSTNLGEWQEYRLRKPRAHGQFAELQS